MTTTTTTPTTAATAAVARSLPGAELSTHVSLAETLSQTGTMAWRATMKMRRNFEQLFDVTIQPLLFTAMFAYIFGGAISGSVKDYLPTIITGIMVQTSLTACMATGTQMREDMEKGVFDRFRSLPSLSWEPRAGRADQARPRRLDELLAEYAERTGPDLVPDAMALLRKLSAPA
jgi:ABC-2 type transport system permease protein